MTTELVRPALNVDKCNVLLLDIAGTTTSNTFLKETLFSYVDKQVETFLKEKWDDEAVKKAVKDLKDGELDQEAAVALVKELTTKNSDNKGLKTLQGLIYKQGYENGEIKAHVFDDVLTVLESWSKLKKVAVYSTGSLESQKLLFSHTTEGDLSSHIANFFDQDTGAKTEAASYEKISKELGVKPEEIVFVTDNVEEAKAAKTAGLVTSLITREGNDPIPEDAAKDYPTIATFKEILLEKSVKRKNEEDTPPVEEEPPTKVAKTEENGHTTNGTSTEEATAPTAEKQEKEEAMEVDATVTTEKTQEVAVAEAPIAETKETIKTEEPTAIEEPTTETKTDVKEPEKEQKEPEKPVEIEKKAETTTTKAEELPKIIVEEEKKQIDVDDSKMDATTTTDEEKKEVVVEEKKEEAPTKEKKIDEPKVEEKKEVSEKNGDEKPKEEEEKKEVVVEKENKSDLANGVDKEVTNGKEDEKQNGEASVEGAIEEIKTKKIDEVPPADVVSVEV